MYLCHSMTNISLAFIGEVLGDRALSSVMFGIEHVENEIRQDAEYRRTIDTLVKEIEQQA